MSIGKRIFQGAGISLIEHGVKMACVLVSTPVMARSLGQEGYGMWLVGMSFLAYMLVVDLGLTFSTTRFLAKAIGAGDEVLESQVIALSGRYFKLMGWVILLGSASAIWVIPWLVNNGENVRDLVLGTLLCGATLSLRFHFRIPGMLLRAHLRYDLQSWASIIRVIVQTAGVCVVLLNDRGILAVAVVQGGCDCLEILLQRIFSAHLMRHNKQRAINVSECGQLKKDLFQYTRDILLGSVGDVFRGQVGPMVISRTRGPSDVATYSVSTRVLGMSNDLANALFGGVLLTAFAQLHGSGDRTRLKREFERATRVTAGFGAWLIGGVLLFGGAFIERWLGSEFVTAYDLLAILAVPHALVIMQYPAYNLLFTIGGQRALMLVSCFGGVAAGILSLVLVKYWGVQGVAIALAIELSTASLVAIPLLLRLYCGIRAFNYMSVELLWPAMKGLCVPMVCAWMVRDQVRADYGSLLFCGTIYAAGFGIAAPWMLLDRNGRQTLTKALQFWK